MDCTIEQIEDVWVYHGFLYKRQAVEHIKKQQVKKAKAARRKELITKLKQIIKLLKKR